MFKAGEESVIVVFHKIRGVIRQWGRQTFYCRGRLRELSKFLKDILCLSVGKLMHVSFKHCSSSRNSVADLQSMSSKITQEENVGRGGTLLGHKIPSHIEYIVEKVVVWLR